MRRALPLALLLLAAQAPRPATAPLLDALKKAPNEAASTAIEAQIRNQWRDAASPAVKLLLGRAARELSENNPGEALDSYDAALDLDPELLEGWRGRAGARLRLGDPAGAARDLAEALRREPRNFAAWQDLSRVAEARGDWAAALSAWQRALDLAPHLAGGADRLRELRRKAVGQDT